MMMGQPGPGAPLVVAGRYRVVGEIGRGGMGAVWLVEHVHTGDQLALKVLHRAFGDNPDIVERFRREARAAAKIKSEHVVRVIDADISPELGGVPFMVMEVLDGEDARRRLRTLGTFTKDATVHALWQIARALDRAHAAGIVHRDIKPENIFFHKREDGVEIVKLLDFGVAKMRDEVTLDDAHSTQAGTLLGTPYFMAPEQARNAPVTAQTDVWAVGMLAYRFLVGANYWPSATTGELMALILTEPMTAPSARAPQASLGAAFDSWFARSCDRDPSRRWASVGEQVAALADVFAIALPASVSMSGSAPFGPATQSHSGVVAAPAPSVAPPRSMLGFWIGLGAVLVLGLLAGGYFIYASRHDAATPATTATATPTVTTTVTATATATGTATATQTASAAPTIDVAATMDLTQPQPPPTATSTATAKPKKKGDDDPWAR
jgi:eukaryotic-like serine/threonine-protein kinase